MSLLENVHTEPISQKQMIMESAAQKLDEDTRKHILPLLEVILKAQPTISIKSYQQTSMTINMPKSRYQSLGTPQVGSIIDVQMLAKS